MIPVLRPMISDAEEQAVLRVLRSGWLISGPEVKAFEHELEERVGGHVVVVSSATAGLHLVLHALISKRGSTTYVDVPALTHVSTADAVHLAGGIPRFADVHPQTLLMGDAPTDQRFVIPVDLYGNLWMPSSDADRYEHVIVDAAHSFGTRSLPPYATAAVYSFHAMKNITSGEGGAIVVHDPVLARELRLLREHGQDRDSPGREVLIHGFKYNMPDILAALGRAQLVRLDEFLACRAALLARYEEKLRGVIDYVPSLPDRAPHLFIVRHPDRDNFKARLRAEGIGTVVQYQSILELEAWKLESLYQSAPVAKQAGTEVLSLPLWPGLTFEEQDRVIEAVKEACNDDA